MAQPATTPAVPPPQSSSGQATATNTTAGPVVAAIVGGNDELMNATLLGRGGEIYRSSAPLQFTRIGSGGIGPTVAGGYLGKELYVIGDRDPVFVRGKDAYFADKLPARGAVAAALNDSTKVIAIGRQVYGLEASGTGWARLSGLPATPTAIWGAPDGTLFASLHRNKQGPTLVAANGKAQKEFAAKALASILAPDERVRSIHAAPGATRRRVAYLLTSVGRILYVDGERVSPIAIPTKVGPPSAEPATVRVTAAHMANNTLTVLAHTSDVSPRSIRLEIRDGKIAESGDGPPLPAGDFATLLVVDKAGKVLAATAHGRVWAHNEGSWQPVALTQAADATDNGAPQTAPKTGPARSR